MRMAIHKNTIENQKSGSGKAIYLTARFGKSQIHDKPVWFPLSQLKIGEFNECGWATIDIPDWLLVKNCLTNAVFTELEHCDF